ncbi:MAG: glycosyltransferase family 39 protein [Candidatus Aenigmarchaeota archaeon]|nr:glycosyltransferase family 39 protein [Candidatus Aenigmarchaeota archaeon]
MVRALFVFAVFLAFTVNLITSAVFTPMTYDEPLHIASGYTKFWLGDFRMNTEQPPLAHYVQGLMVSFAKPSLNLNHSSWTEKNMTQFSQRFFFTDNTVPDTFLFLGRIPSILFALLLAVVVYFFAAELYGYWAGILSIALLSFEPNIIGHGSVATTDMAFTSLMLITIYCLWKYAQKPAMKQLMWFAISFGLLQLTKYTAILTAPIFFVLILAVVLLQKRKLFTLAKNAVAGIFITALVAWIIINAAYFFSGTGTSIGSAMNVDEHLDEQYAPQKILSNLPDWIVYSLPNPLPYPYVKGLGFVMFESKSSIRVKLFNVVSVKGFRSYYLFAFLFKTPLALIALFTISLFILFRNMLFKKMASAELIILIFVIFFFTAFSFTSKQIGIRHILPVYPLFIILAGKLSGIKTMKWVIIILVALNVLSGVSSLPKPLSYYNEIIGAENGWKVFADSNTDWGFDFDELLKYLAEKNMTTASMKILTTQDFAFYNILARSVPIVCERGIHLASVHAVYLNGAQWLSSYSPTEQIGTSIFAYNISSCSTPAVAHLQFNK